MPSHVKELVTFIPFTVLYGALCVITFYFVYEAWENRGLFLLVLFIWILPVMVAMVMLVLKMPQPSLVWVSSISPAGGYSYGLYSQPHVALPTKGAFFFSMLVQIIILAFAATALFNKKLKGRKVMVAS